MSGEAQRYLTSWDGIGVVVELMLRARRDRFSLKVRELKGRQS